MQSSLGRAAFQKPEDASSVRALPHPQSPRSHPLARGCRVDSAVKKSLRVDVAWNLC